MMKRNWLILGSILGLLAVLLGAFAAHGLEGKISDKMLKSFETGVKFQFYHAFFALFLSTTSWLNLKKAKILLYLILIGVVLFSGSIYLLSTSDIIGVSFKKIAFLTPMGGVLLIASWVYFLVNCLKMKTK